MATKKAEKNQETKPKSMLEVAKELADIMKIEKKPDAKGNREYLKKYILQAAKNLWPEDQISDDAKQMIGDLGFDLERHFEEVRMKREEEEAQKGGEKTKESKPKKEKAEKAPKESKPKEPKERTPVDHSKSNKAIVYKAWKAGTKDPEKLHKKVNEAVKLTTITAWIRAWANGKMLPAIANDDK